MEHDDQSSAPSSSRRQLLAKAGLAGLTVAAGTAMLSDGAGAQEPQVVFVPYGPVRLYDTRVSGGRLMANQQRTLVGAADPSEFAHMYNVTVTDTQGSAGFLAVFPGDIDWPGTSSVNWFGPGQTLANGAYTWLSLDGNQSIRIRAGGPSGSSTHVVLDLVGILTILSFDSAIASHGLAALTSADRQLRAAGPDEDVEAE